MEPLNHRLATIFLGRSADDGLFLASYLHSDAPVRSRRASDTATGRFVYFIGAFLHTAEPNVGSWSAVVCRSDGWALCAV